MRALLPITATALAAAMLATTLPAAPALAKGGNGPAFSSGPTPSFSPTPDFRDPRGSVFLRDRDRRRNRVSGDSFIYPPEYQGDSVWRSDSFNDWWHERPNRSYPAWVQRNHDCQRQWWQGNVLTC